jgi:arabinogalactan oligomer/maltooligosaccharide transport system permease protein
MTGFARRYWYAIGMVAPVGAVLLVLVGFPLARGVFLSLTNATEANVGRTIGENVIPPSYDFVGLHNYVEILTGREGDFYGRLIWTVIWTVSCVALHYGIGLGLAMMLNRPMRGRAIYRVLLILPWAVPGFVAAFAWRFMFNTDFGLINAGLHSIGIGPVGWLDNEILNKLSVITVNVWMGVPFMMVALLGGLQAIPKELYEAAEVDGASAWQRFRAITLPGLSNVSGTVILLGVIWTFNKFDVIYLMGGGPGGSSEILGTFAYRLGFQGIRNYSGAATYGVLILSILLVFASFYRRSLRRQGEFA